MIRAFFLSPLVILFANGSQGRERFDNELIGAYRSQGLAKDPSGQQPPTSGPVMPLALNETGPNV